MKRYTLLISTCAMLVFSSAQGQSYRSAVNEGNERYNQQQYDGAREKYEQAAVSEPERPESYFNHGNAAYRAEDIKAALEQYEKAGTRVRSKEELSRTLYNAGNTFLNAAEKGTENPVLQKAAGEQAGDLRMEGYKKAIDLYKQTLKLNPHDSDARYNLTYAKKKLEELQQKQNQDKDQKKDQKNDKDKDQDKKDKNKQDEQQKKDQQDEKDQKQENQKDKDQKQDAKKNEQQKSKPEKQKNMSKQQAEQILRALERDEKELQKKKRQKTSVRVSVEKDW